jgi:hypothetical protein
MTKRESPACDITAIAPEKRGAHLETTKKLFRSVKSFLELPNWYAFQFPNESDVLLTAAEFITLERLCCPFLEFEIEVEREGGPVSLRLTGREGLKPFIMAEIGEHLPASVQSRNTQYSHL